MSTFWINDTVEARWRGGDKWYAGLIDRIHDDSYDVVYNDGDREEKVPKDLIRAFESRGRRKKEQESAAPAPAPAAAPKPAAPPKKRAEEAAPKKKPAAAKAEAAAPKKKPAAAKAEDAAPKKRAAAGAANPAAKKRAAADLAGLAAYVSERGGDASALAGWSTYRRGHADRETVVFVDETGKRHVSKMQAFRALNERRADGPAAEAAPPPAAEAAESRAPGGADDAAAAAAPPAAEAAPPAADDDDPIAPVPLVRSAAGFVAIRGDASRPPERRDPVVPDGHAVVEVDVPYPAAGGGYGATIGERGDDIIVSKLRTGGAAADAGLRVGDVVLSVRGWDATRQDFDDVHDRCKAAAGARAPLLLLVARENDAEAMPPPAPREPAAATTPPPFVPRPRAAPADAN